MRFVVVLSLSLVVLCSTRPAQRAAFPDIINESLGHLVEMEVDESVMLDTPTNVRDKSLVPHHLDIFIKSLEKLNQKKSLLIQETLTTLRSACKKPSEPPSSDVTQPEIHEKQLSNFIKELSDFLKFLNRKGLCKQIVNH